MKKTNLSGMYMEIAKFFFFAAVVSMIFFITIGEIKYPSERRDPYENCRVFEANWQRILADGSKVSAEFPGKVPAERGEVVTLVTTLPTEIAEKECIFFRSIWQDLKVYVDGQLREVYNTEKSRPYGTNSAFRYVRLELHEEDEGKELTLEVVSDSKYAGVLRTCYIGDEMSFWMFLLGESGAKTVLAVALLVLSSFCIVVCIGFKLLAKKMLPLHYLAWTIFLCALWTLSEVEFRQLLVKNVSIITNCTYWTLMLIPMTVLIYINLLQEGRYKKLYFLPIVYAISTAVLGTVLQVFDVVQFVQQLPFIHGGTVISIICVITTISIDIFKKHIYDYLAVSIGIFGMLLTAVMEMILYYLGVNLSLGTVLVVGLLFLLVMAIVKTGQDLVRSERNRQQAVTAREAQAKFLANMSHEIRTPINAVVGMNEMILRENENPDIQEYARNIQSASTMLLGLVNDILDFSKIESGLLELVEDTYSVVPMLQDELLLLNTKIVGKPIAIHIDVDPKIPSKLWGDELRIKQIITNLLSNAVKYTQEGSVTFKAFYEITDADNIEFCFSVIDTGVGIKQEDLSNLFDSFKRLELTQNRNIEGTGLGLNIVQQLVERMQGKITVESEYGKGSNFTVTLPQKIMDRTPIGDMESAEEERRRKNQIEKSFFMAPEASVLAVDDNAMNLAVVKGLLKRTKIKLDTVAGGRECLEYTKQKKYDLILMDHMMPEMDGVQALHLLQGDASNPNRKTPVIALTANAIAGCQETYLAYGFNDYISKPIQGKRLDEILIKHLPKELITFQNEESGEAAGGKSQEATPKVEESFLVVDRKLGLSYSLDSEEIYGEVLDAFCEQSREYLPQLQECFDNHNWEKYGIITHAIKGNALNVGASEFSKLSLLHERAAKEGNIDFIRKEYNVYIATLERLIAVVEAMKW